MAKAEDIQRDVELLVERYLQRATEPIDKRAFNVIWHELAFHVLHDATEQVHRLYDSTLATLPGLQALMDGSNDALARAACSAFALHAFWATQRGQRSAETRVPVALTPEQLARLAKAARMEKERSGQSESRPLAGALMALRQADALVPAAADRAMRVQAMRHAGQGGEGSDEGNVRREVCERVVEEAERRLKERLREAKRISKQEESLSLAARGYSSDSRAPGPPGLTVMLDEYVEEHLRKARASLQRNSHPP